MNSDDPEFLCVLREAMKDRDEESSQTQPRHERPRYIEELKVTKFHKFIRGTNQECYLDWEINMERIFKLNSLDDGKS